MEPLLGANCHPEETLLPGYVAQGPVKLLADRSDRKADYTSDRPVSRPWPGPWSRGQQCSRSDRSGAGNCQGKREENQLELPPRAAFDASGGRRVLGIDVILPRRREAARERRRSSIEVAPHVDHDVHRASRGESGQDLNPAQSGGTSPAEPLLHLSPEQIRAGRSHRSENRGERRRESRGERLLGPRCRRCTCPEAVRSAGQAQESLSHAFTRRVRRELYEEYHLFLSAFRNAADRLRSGDRAAKFPLRSDPPGVAVG